ncbi:transmembrane protein [Arabidopsis thaliana]|uniref:Transmembrane protein n=1 Tax=Arabidopsis thaliana TaxID=3702 RepID=B3H6N9_ARATH|nr:uncharacterized protein AT2G09838 [Arabidopsis thaliana]AEC06135.1 transmembrane protein [Arabidopsis thaliana]|eukprot:NP_001118291.1 transmembrane protein [Arabidopsis thaliana]
MMFIRKREGTNRRPISVPERLLVDNFNVLIGLGHLVLALADLITNLGPYSLKECYVSYRLCV